jgi:hypothetical protein
MQEVTLRKRGRIGAGQPNRQIDTERHGATGRRIAQTGKQRADVPDHRRCCQTPRVAFAPGYRDPALARIDAPVGMRDNRGAMQV